MRRLRAGRPLLVGVVHLPPLPGAPVPSPGMEAVLVRARLDAAALREGGADALIVENFGDAPFTAESVDPATIAAMTRAVLVAREAAPDLLLGVNVLRNDAIAAVAVAAVTGADFVRVNVHTGASLTDQGIVTGRARETLLERRRLGADLALAADVDVKHAVPLAPVPFEQSVRDTWTRGHADVLIVTGSATGLPPDPDRLDTARRAAPDAVLWAGSGMDPSLARAWRDRIDGAIVGTYLHEEGDIARPVDARRVAAVREALKG